MSIISIIFAARCILYCRPEYSVKKVLKKPIEGRNSSNVKPRRSLDKNCDWLVLYLTKVHLLHYKWAECWLGSSSIYLRLRGYYLMRSSYDHKICVDCAWLI